mgnify:CR=1 FL=1
MLINYQRYSGYLKQSTLKIDLSLKYATSYLHQMCTSTLIEIHFKDSWYGKGLLLMVGWKLVFLTFRMGKFNIAR